MMAGTEPVELQDLQLDAHELQASMAQALQKGDNVSVFQHLEALDLLYDVEGRWRGRGEAVTFPVELLYRCLAANHPDLVPDCTRVLGKVLLRLSEEQLLSDLQTELEEGLAHPAPEVQELVLGQLLRVVSKGLGAELVGLPIVGQMLGTLASDTLSVANAAGRVITELSKAEAGLEYLLSDAETGTLAGLLAKPGVLSLRVQTLFVQMACQDDAMVGRLVEQGPLRSLVATLEGSDALLKLNTIELFKTLASTPAGLQYLEASGSLASMLRLLSGEDVYCALLAPTVYEFVAQLPASGGDLAALDAQFRFLSAIQRDVVSGDETVQQAALATVKALARAPSGLRLLHGQQQGGPILQSLWELVQHAGRQQRLIAALHTLAAVWDGATDQDTDVELRQSLFEATAPGADITARVFELASSPFVDIRVAVFAVMQSLASQAWGRKALIDQPGFLEFLTDRKTEHQFEMMKWKYALAEAIAGSADCVALVDGKQLLGIKQYVRDGIAYKGSEVGVAIDADGMG